MKNKGRVLLLIILVMISERDILKRETIARNNIPWLVLFMHPPLQLIFRNLCDSFIIKQPQLSVLVRIQLLYQSLPG